MFKSFVTQRDEARTHAANMAELLTRIIRVSPKLKMEVDGVTFYDTLIIKDAINALESWKAAQ
jgi:hypothetical protein